MSWKIATDSNPQNSNKKKKRKKKEKKWPPIFWADKSPFLKGVLHLLPQKASKLACFVLYLKIINIFWKNNICIL